MAATSRHSLVNIVRSNAAPCTTATATDALLGEIDPAASVVLIGEATHGTHEFYRIRADLTRALIERRGFTIVAVEADWPDAFRAHRWVNHRGSDPDARTALDDFTRFPRWMWRNRDVARYLEWQRTENAARDAADRAGFFGLDLYSLHRSMARVECDATQGFRYGPSAASTTVRRFSIR